MFRSLLISGVLNIFVFIPLFLTPFSPPTLLQEFKKHPGFSQFFHAIFPTSTGPAFLFTPQPPPRETLPHLPPASHPQCGGSPLPLKLPAPALTTHPFLDFVFLNLLMASGRILSSTQIQCYASHRPWSSPYLEALKVLLVPVATSSWAPFHDDPIMLLFSWRYCRWTRQGVVNL